MRLTDTTLMNSVGLKPHDGDAEAGLLACIGKNTDHWADALERGICEEWFMVPIHTTIVSRMIENDNAGWEVDDITISLSLPEEQRPDAFCVFDSVQTTGHFQMFLEKVEGAWLKRKTIDTCHSVIEMAYEQGSRAPEIVEHGGSEFSKLALKEKSKLKTGAEVMAQTWENIKIRQAKGGMNGIPSGLKTLDSMTCGWQDADLIVLAARTSVGKTALSIELTLSALRAHKTVQYFSLEMMNEAVMERMLANTSEVPVRVMVDKVMTQGQSDAVEQAKNFLSGAKLYMEDAGDMSVATIRAKARKLARSGLDMIVVDYCQIVRPEDARAPREQQVAGIVWGLKALAKELKIPIIMLSQVNRNAANTNMCPKLSDLADSDRVGRDADLVVMLWKKDGKDGAEEHFVELSKQRNGRLGPIPVEFKKSIQAFEEKQKKFL